MIWSGNPVTATQWISIKSMDLHLSVCVFSQDFKAGLAVAEVELTAANIRDVDRRSFDINTPFKNFWYVWTHVCMSFYVLLNARTLYIFVSVSCPLFPTTKSYLFLRMCVWCMICLFRCGGAREKSALFLFHVSALTLTNTVFLIAFPII